MTILKCQLTATCGLRLYDLQNKPRRTMTIIVLAVLVLLFLGSLVIGPGVFSSYERGLDLQLTQAQQSSPETAEAVRK